jgi:hypothetical protein
MTHIRKDLPETHLLIDGDGTLPLLLPDAGQFCRRFPGLIRPRLRYRQPQVLRQITLLSLKKYVFFSHNKSKLQKCLLANFSLFSPEHGPKGSQSVYRIAFCTYILYYILSIFVKFL